ncbi:MAG: hypothetical protein ACLUDU_09085 [Butyricimonas faecihominis]
MDGDRLTVSRWKRDIRAPNIDELIRQHGAKIVTVRDTEGKEHVLPVRYSCHDR